MADWSIRRWSGLHFGREWHWVWLTHGPYHKHGYGPTLNAAHEAALTAPMNSNVEEVFRRR